MMKDWGKKNKRKLKSLVMALDTFYWSMCYDIPDVQEETTNNKIKNYNIILS